MQNKLAYLNNEKKLYEYISNNLNEDNKLITTDTQLATSLNISISTAFRWRQKLIDKKLITCKIQVINNKKQCVIKLRG